MASDTDHRRRITSFDVAERAGVSQSTVSRALSGDPSIAPPTRKRVEDAAASLGYRVDESAARLRRGKTGTIAVVVITSGEGDMLRVNPFHYNLLGSVCAAASERGYRALVSFQSGPHDLEAGQVETRQADYLVVLGTSTNDAAWEFHRESVERNGAGTWGAPFDCEGRVGADNIGGARIAVRRLLEAGHRHIAFIGEPDDRQMQFSERYAGYRKALQDAGLEPGEPVFAAATSRLDQGSEAVRRLLASGRQFDALFCSCDAVALGALDGLRQAGIAVPDKVGVIGFDGLDIGAHSNPPLTSIAPDFAIAGARLVARAMEGGTPEPVPVTLVERASVRPRL